MKEKGKFVIGALVMALLGAFIALITYTQILEKPATAALGDNSNISVPAKSAVLTSYLPQQGQVDLTFAAEQTVHAVVNVRTKSIVQAQASNPLFDWFYGDGYNQQPREAKGIGSGVIISRDGYIITNNHVVENAEDVSVKLNDNREFQAEIVGRDPQTDIALLKIKANDLPFIKYGDSDQLKLGEWVLAVGNPFNLTSTVTAGIVSAKGRSLNILDDQYKIESFIQTDAALNPGNSGGALVNTQGYLVGITSAIISPSGAYAGNSFAIPINIVRKVVDDLKEYGTVQRAIIGVEIGEVTPQIAEDQKLSEVSGAIISKIVSGGAAEEAGLKTGDVIVGVDGVKVASPAELQEQVGKHRPGDKATISYFRKGKENSVQIVMKNLEGSTRFVTAEEGSGVVFGASLEPLTQADKRSYDVDSGVKVTDVRDGKFRSIGIRKGYVISSVNGKKVSSASDVREVTANGKNLKSIEGYQEDGTFFTFRFGN
jgi:Do/DeqQ family serine protease